MKVTKLFPILLLLTTFAYGQQLEWISFDWDGDSLGNKYFDKSVILIPIEIENLPYKFNAQFDLGATETMFYGNAIAPVLKTNQQLRSKIDTSAIIWIQSTKNPTIKDVSLKLNNVSFGKRNVALFKDYGDSLTIDSLKSNTVKHIGTIGADLFQDKVLIIDYKNNRLAVTDEVPQQYINAEFQLMKIDDGRIKIPFSIADTTYYVMFDTGSSIFELTTDEENLKHCITANSPIVDSLLVSSWGVFHYLYGRRINDLKVGSKSFPNAKVYESKGEDWVRFHKAENIIGGTGNALFLENTVIIDYKNHRFGVQ